MHGRRSCRAIDNRPDHRSRDVQKTSMTMTQLPGDKRSPVAIEFAVTPSALWLDRHIHRVSCRRWFGLWGGGGGGAEEAARLTVQSCRPRLGVHYDRPGI